VQVGKKELVTLPKGSDGQAMNRVDLALDPDYSPAGGLNVEMKISGNDLIMDGGQQRTLGYRRPAAKTNRAR
jgi:hypothetical protein